MSAVVRVVRQFHEGAESITLAKVSLTVVGVTLKPIVDGPGMKPPTIEITLIWEPLAAAPLARAGGWKEVASEPDQPHEHLASDGLRESSRGAQAQLTSDAHRVPCPRFWDTSFASILREERCPGCPEGTPSVPLRHRR